MPDFNLFQADKLGHAAAYALLVWLTLRGVSRLKKPEDMGWRHGFFVFLFASGFGVLMEFVQRTFFPGRHFEFDDMLANTAGAAAGWFIYTQFSRTTE